LLLPNGDIEHSSYWTDHHISPESIEVQRGKKWVPLSQKTREADFHMSIRSKIVEVIVAASRLATAPYLLSEAVQAYRESLHDMVQRCELCGNSADHLSTVLAYGSKYKRSACPECVAQLKKQDMLREIN
jgi:hypothetical protein